MTLVHSEIPLISQSHPGIERWYAITEGGVTEKPTSTSAMLHLASNGLPGDVMLDSKLYGRRIVIRRNTDGSWTPVDPVNLEQPDDYGEP